MESLACLCNCDSSIGPCMFCVIGRFIDWSGRQHWRLGYRKSTKMYSWEQRYQYNVQSNAHAYKTRKHFTRYTGQVRTVRMTRRILNFGISRVLPGPPYIDSIRSLRAAFSSSLWTMVPASGWDCSAILSRWRSYLCNSTLRWIWYWIGWVLTIVSTNDQESMSNNNVIWRLRTEGG